MTTILISPERDAHDRQTSRQQVRRRTLAERARQPIDGALILVGVPPQWPPLLAAVQHLPSAIRLRKASIRIDREGSSWERSVEWITREARRLWLGRTLSGVISLSRQSEPAKGYVRGVTLSDTKGVPVHGE